MYKMSKRRAESPAAQVLTPPVFLVQRAGFLDSEVNFW